MKHGAYRCCEFYWKRWSTLKRLKNKFTLSSIRLGLMPKNGLMGMAGMISASGSDGRGVIQIPPVSVNIKPQHIIIILPCIAFWNEYMIIHGTCYLEGGYYFSFIYLYSNTNIVNLLLGAQTIKNDVMCNSKVTYYLLSTAKQGDNVLGSVRPSVCLWVCVFVRALLFVPFDLRLWYLVCRSTLTLPRLGL